MSAQPKVRMTREEYLTFERASDTRHEFWDGVIYAMAGASRNHVRITGHIFASFHAQLRGAGCEPFASDLRVRVNAKNAYVYPDVLVVCDTPEFDDSQLDTLLNPTLIVEVLSESTDRYDRVAKLQAYRNLPSMRDYLLISQDSLFIEHYIYRAGAWVYATYEAATDVLQLPSIGCQLAVTDIYERVEFPPSSQ